MSENKIRFGLNDFPESIKIKAKFDALKLGKTLKDYIIELIKKGF